MGKFVNARQSKGERRRKYKWVKKMGFNYFIARVLRDWTKSHIRIFAKNNMNYKGVKKWKIKKI